MSNNPTTPSGGSFATWLSRHPCTREELWKIQNMLGDCMPDSELHESALETWLDSSKHTFPDPHWDEGCIKCGGFDGEPCEPPETRLGERPTTLSDALSLDGAAGSSQRRQDCSEGHLQVRDGVCIACGRTWLDSLREDVNGVKPEVPSEDPKFTSSAEWAWSTLKFEEIRFKAEEVEEFIYDLLYDHARLIEAVEKKEGVKAFADLHFPPAA